VQTEAQLRKTLKRLKLSGMLTTLPDRLAFSRKEKLDYTEFLELILGDEAQRRDQVSVQTRLRNAGFEEECTLEGFDWSADIRFDKARLNDLFGLHFIERRENIILTGPVGVGKTFLACALGHSACRAGYRVLFTRADAMLKSLAQSRADNSFDRQLRHFLNPDLLVIDDFRSQETVGTCLVGFLRTRHRAPHAEFIDRNVEPRRRRMGRPFSTSRSWHKAAWTGSVIGRISS